MKIKKAIIYGLLLVVPLLIINIDVFAESTASLNSQLEAQRAEVDKLQTEINKKDEQLKKAEKERDDLNSDINSAKEKKANLESEMNSLLEEEKSMLMFLQKNQEIMSSVLILAVGTEEQIKDAQSTKEGLDIILGQFSRKIEVLDEKQDEIDEITAKLVVQETELKRNINVIKQDKESATNLLNQQNAKIDALKAEIASKNLKPTGSHSVKSKSKIEIMKAAGLKEYEYDDASYIISRESGWKYDAQNRYSGAYGLCQAVPGSKMRSAGADWQTNPVTQMKWCNNYAKSRYGSWAGAVRFWKSNHWW